jgi:hypothetical protein
LKRQALKRRFGNGGGQQGYAVPVW